MRKKLAELSRRQIIGIIILTIGGLITASLIISTVRDIPIWFFGNNVTAIIKDSWYENTDEDEFVPIYFFKYEFMTLEGESIVATTRVSEQDWSRYAIGDELPVIYSPLNSSNYRIDDSRYVPLLLCSYIPFLLLCIITIKVGWEFYYY